MSLFHNAGLLWNAVLKKRYETEISKGRFMMAIWMMEPSNIVLYFTIPVFKFGVKVSDSCHQKEIFCAIIFHVVSHLEQV